MSIETLCDFIRDNSDCINKDLISDYPLFVLPWLESTSEPTANLLESTKEVEIRLKKLNVLEERLENLTKRLKKSKTLNEQCDMHPISRMSLLSDRRLNSFLNKQVPSLGSSVTTDEAVIEEHVSNIAKIKKFCDEMTCEIENFNFDQPILPALTLANDVSTLLTKVSDDIDDLEDYNTMFNGLSNNASVDPFADGMEKLKNILYQS